jgi:hypothetical protein
MRRWVEDRFTGGLSYRPKPEVPSLVLRKG